MPTVTDMFCGAGGSSLGAQAAGAEIRLALNHWPTAIETHNTNFPTVDHDCTDISACDPRRYAKTDILIASPECTCHSIARGVSRKNQWQRTLFDQQIDPSAERSRATMWDVVRFAEHHQYSAIVVENVPDARMWICWDAWLQAMTALGYDHKVLYLNSRFFPTVPQSRDRLYGVFWRKELRRPELEFRPSATCTKCGRVSAVQSWKRRSFGRYRAQYIYRCEKCSQEVIPIETPASAAIDWTIKGERIGGREKPLVERTLNRIKRGLEKFAGQHLVIGNFTPGYARPAVTTPFGTITTVSQQAICQVPFLVSYYGTGGTSAVTDPVPTITTRDRHGLVSGFIVENHGTSTARSIRSPLSTVCASTIHHGLVAPITPNIEDCWYRMLDVHEIQAAMAFKPSYAVLGKKREKIRQLGNAVTPPVMEWIVSRLLPLL